MKCMICRNKKLMTLVDYLRDIGLSYRQIRDHLRKYGINISIYTISKHFQHRMMEQLEKIQLPDLEKETPLSEQQLDRLFDDIVKLTATLPCHEAIRLKETLEQMVKEKEEKKMLEPIPTVQNTWRMLFDLFNKADLEEYIPKLKERYLAALTDMGINYKSENLLA